MTDVVVCTKRIKSIIRLKMKRNHVVDVIALKRCFVAVNIVRIFFIDDLPVLVEGRRMKNVIMIEKSDIIARCHAVAGIGISGNSLVLFKFFINDTGILRCIFFADFPDIGMLRIGPVRKTEFPVFVGLCAYRVDHVAQEFFRCII